MHGVSWDRAHGGPVGMVHARAHGVLQRQLPGQSVGTGSRGPVRTGSPGTSRVAAVALRLGSRGLGVVLLLVDAPELHGSVLLRT